MTFPETADLLVRNARLVATMDDQRRELAGGWVAVTNGLVSAVGSSTQEPPTSRDVIDATDCLVTPGLVNTHHHIYQNLTRAFPPMTDKPLFGWLQSLYPLWRGIDEESVYVSTFVGLAELALSGTLFSEWEHTRIPGGPGGTFGHGSPSVVGSTSHFHPGAMLTLGG
ncbi:MAG: 8-oxoguanine deaminase, partial [Ilumatobacteraceae bacterium]